MSPTKPKCPLFVGESQRDLLACAVGDDDLGARKIHCALRRHGALDDTRSGSLPRGLSLCDCNRWQRREEEEEDKSNR